MRRKDREVTDINDIEEILQVCKTCHIAMIDGDAPYVVPMNYGYRLLGGGILELYFHCAWEGRKLDALRRNNKVCFDMAYEGGPYINHEFPNKSGFKFASVIGFGHVEFIDAPDEKCEALSALFKHQSGLDISFTPDIADKACIFKIVSKDFTGKKNMSLR